MADPSAIPEWILYVAGFLGTMLGALILRLGWKAAPKPDSVVASVGVELGNRLQMDMLIAAVNRVGDILEGKKQGEIEDKLDELLSRVPDLPPRRR